MSDIIPLPTCFFSLTRPPLCIPSMRHSSGYQWICSPTDPGSSRHVSLFPHYPRSQHGFPDVPQDGRLNLMDHLTNGTLIITIAEPLQSFCPLNFFLPTHSSVKKGRGPNPTSSMDLRDQKINIPRTYISSRANPDTPTYFHV